MRKRSKRFSIAWGPTLWAAVFVQLGFGIWLSPISAVKRVRVEGAPTEIQAMLKSRIQHLKNVPLAQVRSTQMESDALGIQDLESAQYEQNVFGRGVLQVKVRRPVANFAGKPKLMLSDRGVIFRTQRPTEDLPKIEIPNLSERTHLTAGNSWQAKTAAEWIANLPDSLRNGQATFEVKATGEVCLRSGRKATVQFGFPDKREEKFRVLSELIAQQSELLSQVRELNLVAPDRPVVRR